MAKLYDGLNFVRVHFLLFALNAIRAEIQYHRRECLYWLAIFEERKTWALSLSLSYLVSLYPCPPFEAILSSPVLRERCTNTVRVRSSGPLMDLLFTSRRRVSAHALAIASRFENQSLYRIAGHFRPHFCDSSAESLRPIATDQTAPCLMFMRIVDDIRDEYYEYVRWIEDISYSLNIDLKKI